MVDISFFGFGLEGIQFSALDDPPLKGKFCSERILPFLKLTFSHLKIAG